MIKKLLGSVREYKSASIMTPLCMIGEVVMECLIPFITADMVNMIKAGCEFSEIAKYGLILFLMACFSLLFGALGGIVGSKASCGFAKNLRKDMYYRVQGFSFANIDKFSASSLVTRMTTDVSFVQMAYMMVLRIGIRCPLMFIFSIVMAFLMGGKLAFMFVVVVPILGFGLFMVTKKAMPMFHRVFKKYDELNASIQENVKGMRVVKSYVREEYEKKKFTEASANLATDFTKAERIVALNGPLMQFCLYIDMVVVLFFGSYLIISTKGTALDVGQFSAMITYGFMILMSLMMLSMIFVMLTLAGESAVRIAEVLSEETTLTNPENPVKEVADGSVEFRKVSFKYSEKAENFALSDINLSIRSGETVGILGGTGSSKTTLIQLISRLYDATEGEVVVGGVNVKDYDMEVLRNQVAVVLQKNVLFSGTIKENLRWGNAEATDEQLVEACKLAQADEFIQTFPDKYDTYIEQGGSNVSGGQKQRLCIARALLKRPRVLILDDSTSAVDTRTDALIRKAFREFIPETTKIIIAQRVSSVQEADKIVILDGGRIDAVGTHEELLAGNKIYQEVFYSQNKGGDEDAGK